MRARASRAAVVTASAVDLSKLGSRTASSAAWITGEAMSLACLILFLIAPSEQSTPGSDAVHGGKLS
jgi:hypothetical protein